MSIFFEIKLIKYTVEVRTGRTRGHENILHVKNIFLMIWNKPIIFDLFFLVARNQTNF